jgi:hypothetical protein
MKLKKFEELPFYLYNYEVDVNNFDVISKNKSISIVKETQRGHKICKLCRNGICSVYTLVDILAYKMGILNKDNYFKRIILKEPNNYSLDSIQILTISEQNKCCGVGGNLKEYWQINGYKQRVREYKTKYDYLTRSKVYRYKNKKNMSNTEISKLLKIPLCTIGRILNNFNACPEIETELHKWIDANLSEVDKLGILRMYKNKVNVKYIANVYKVPPKIVKRIGVGDLW